MNVKLWFAVVVCLLAFQVCITTGSASEPEPSSLEKAMSETLDVWREGRYEQLFEMLAHRGKTSREAFVKKMQGGVIRPACCWQKLENFKVLNEKRTEATVYAKVGLEGSAVSDASATREFKMTHQEGVWKMQMADILSLSGAKSRNGAVAKHRVKKHNSP